MDCAFSEKCGGCVYRHLSFEEYREQKRRAVLTILHNLQAQDFRFAEPFFVGDGQRRRATFAFQMKKGRLSFGFNARASSEIVDIDRCCLLTPGINRGLPGLRKLAAAVCSVKTVSASKGRKMPPSFITAGDVAVTEADNGLDVVLEFDAELNLDYRMEIFELSQQLDNVIRISHRRRPGAVPEAVVEKTKPVIGIAGYEVFIPAGTFLQASALSEKALIDTVLKYAGNAGGKIADLFCGVGTFSYPLSRLPGTGILAVDSSVELLEGFRRSVNKNMISNIDITTRNLFKYPLDEKELNGFYLVVFDPPRAGARAQVQKIAAMGAAAPAGVIAVSCNPHSFVNDANLLISGGYRLEEITLVDQFSYSNHSELVALFTK